MNLTHLYLATPLGVMLQFQPDFWHGLSYGVVNVILGLTIFVQL